MLNIGDKITVRDGPVENGVYVVRSEPFASRGGRMVVSATTTVCGVGVSGLFFLDCVAAISNN